MNIKAQYMLSAGLATLHFETMDWLGKIEFYHDEFHVFQQLTDRRKNNNYMEQQVHKDINLCMKAIMDRLLNLIMELTLHEKYLSNLLMNEKEATNHDFRQKHKLIAQRVIKLEADVRLSKKEMHHFLVVKHPRQRHGFPI